MPNDAQPLPQAAAHNPHGIVTDESLRQFTNYVFGNLSPESSLNATGEQWGWLSHRPHSGGGSPSRYSPFARRSFSYGENILSVDAIRNTFSGIEIRRRGDRYLVNHGRVDYWRDWEFCSSNDPKKQVLGLRSLFDIVRNSSSPTFTYQQQTIPGHYASDGLGRIYIPAATFNSAIFPENSRLTSRAGRALGDSDNEIEFEYLQNSRILNDSGAIRRLSGESDSQAIGMMMRNTGFALSQTRCMIDEFARRRLALEENPNATGQQLADLMRTIPDDQRLRDTRNAYTAALAEFNRDVRPTHRIKDDIKAIEARMGNPALTPIQRDVARQLHSEYRLAEIQIGHAAQQNPNLAFLRDGSIGPETLMALHTVPHSSPAFFMHDTSDRNLFYQNPDSATANPPEQLDSSQGIRIHGGHTNTGWLWMSRFAGFSQNELEQLLDTGNPNDAVRANRAQVADQLAQGFRYLGTHFNLLSQQMLFPAGELDGVGPSPQRSMMYSNILDLRRMASTVLTPQSSDMPETAEFLAAGLRAQFTPPPGPENPMSRRFAIQRLFTAIDNGSPWVSIQNIEQLQEPLRSGQYNHSLADIGITRQDFNEITRLLQSNPNQTGIDAQRVTTFMNGVRNIFNSHGQNGYISKSDIQVIGSAVDISWGLNTSDDVRFRVLPSFGNPLNSSERTVVATQNPNGHHATRTFYARIRDAKNQIETLGAQLAHHQQPIQPGLPERPAFARLPQGEPQGAGLSAVATLPLSLNTALFSQRTDTILNPLTRLPLLSTMSVYP
jgi:hypothetical protein